MIRRHFLYAIAAISALVTSSLPKAVVCLGKDQGTTRYFFEAYSPESAGTDWTDSESQRLIANDPRTDVIHFGTPDFISYFPEDFELEDDEGNLLLDLSGTTWVHSPVIHVTASGVETVHEVYWLVTDADRLDDFPRLSASTGPEGDVSVMAETRLNSLPDASKSIGTAGDPVRFSVGLFKK